MKQGAGLTAVLQTRNKPPAEESNRRNYQSTASSTEVLPSEATGHWNVHTSTSTYITSKVQTGPLQNTLLGCDDVHFDRYQRFRETCYLSLCLRVLVLIPNMDSTGQNLLLSPSREETKKMVTGSYETWHLPTNYTASHPERPPH
jgi:hypothetical protein